MANLQTSANIELQAQSAMPPPVMEYVNKYTDDAIKGGYAPKPPPPITDSYQMFGQTCHQDDVIIRPLETQGIKRLHPENYVKKEELKKLTVSILCNFLDLLDILVKCGLSPGRDEKIEDLNLLFIHLHHLINEFRPHQARETLKVMMKMQQKNLTEAGEKLSKNVDKASEILKQCSDEINTLMSKHKSVNVGADGDAVAMDVDELFPSWMPHPPGSSAESSSQLFSSSSSDKDMLLLGLLDTIKE